MRSQFPVSVILLAIICFAQVACTGSPRPAAGDDLQDLVGVDIAGLDAKAFAAAERRIEAVAGECTDVDYAVLSRSQGVLVLCGRGPVWLLTAVDGSGRKQWQSALELGLDVDLDGWSIVAVSELGADLLSCGFGEGVPMSSMSWALTGRSAVLVGARDAAGRAAFGRVSEVHPDLRLPAGDLDAADPVAKLGELLRLCQPAAKDERHSPSVRGKAEEMVSGTNRYLAEAAGQLLIQP